MWIGDHAVIGNIPKTYKVKVRSKLYKSLSEGDSGTLIILDEDDHKRLFIV